MNSGSYLAYIEAGRCNEDYDVDKGIYEGREDYKVNRVDYANGKDALLIISIADDDNKKVDVTIFFAGDYDTISEFIRTKFGDKIDEDADIPLPLYQTIPDWAEMACDGGEYWVGENCEIRLIIVEPIEILTQEDA